MKEFIKRTSTAIVLASVAYAIIRFFPDYLFSGTLFIIITIGVFEFVKLTAPEIVSLPLMLLNGLGIGFSFTLGKPELPLLLVLILLVNGIYFLIAVNRNEKLPHFVRSFGIHMLSVFYLYFPLYFIYQLRMIAPGSEHKANFLFFMIFVIAIGDSGAYFIGRAIGKTKIYKVASPKKSLEGLIAAILTAALAAWASIQIFPLPFDVALWKVILTGGVIELLSQLSDPIESLFKRSAGQKDSGALFPGHGGILDRLDSYIFCAPALFYIIVYVWK